MRLPVASRRGISELHFIFIVLRGTCQASTTLSLTPSIYGIGIGT